MPQQTTITLPEPVQMLVQGGQDPDRVGTAVWDTQGLEVCADIEAGSVDLYDKESRLIARIEADTADQLAANLLAAAEYLRQFEA